MFPQAVCSVAPRGVYVCGNTTTTSGLTVTLSKDSSSGDFALEAGALVLGDQGEKPKIDNNSGFEFFFKPFPFSQFLYILFKRHLDRTDPIRVLRMSARKI